MLCYGTETIQDLCLFISESSITLDLTPSQDPFRAQWPNPSHTRHWPWPELPAPSRSNSQADWRSASLLLADGVFPVCWGPAVTR
jgi:hypothetical protein